MVLKAYLEKKFAYEYDALIFVSFTPLNMKENKVHFRHLMLFFTGKAKISYKQQTRYVLFMAIPLAVANGCHRSELKRFNSPYATESLIVHCKEINCISFSNYVSLGMAIMEVQRNFNGFVNLCSNVDVKALLPKTCNMVSENTSNLFAASDGI